MRLLPRHASHSVAGHPSPAFSPPQRHAPPPRMLYQAPIPYSERTGGLHMSSTLFCIKSQAKPRSESPDPPTPASSQQRSVAGALFRRSAPPPARPTRPGLSIRNKRPRLGRVSLRSKPLDPDPSVLNQTYRFGLSFFLKRPPVLLISTRTPL